MQKNWIFRTKFYLTTLNGSVAHSGECIVLSVYDDNVVFTIHSYYGEKRVRVYLFLLQYLCCITKIEFDLIQFYSTLNCISVTEL